MRLFKIPFEVVKAIIMVVIDAVSAVIDVLKKR